MEFSETIQGVNYRKREAVYAVVLNEKKEKVAVMVHNGKGFSQEAE